jgi:hypothetical protein
MILIPFDDTTRYDLRLIAIWDARNDMHHTITGVGTTFFAIEPTKIFHTPL